MSSKRTEVEIKIDHTNYNTGCRKERGDEMCKRKKNILISVLLTRRKLIQYQMTWIETKSVAGNEKDSALQAQKEWRIIQPGPD
jgi:hypothetical protein